MTLYSQEHYSYTCTLTGTRIHNSPRKNSPGSCTADSVLRVCDRNGNNFD